MWFFKLLLDYFDFIFPYVLRNVFPTITSTHLTKPI